MLLPSAFGEPGFSTTRDGRRLHHVTRGSGSPTVVFEAGLGAMRGTWGLVQPSVGEITRTLAYDRAGLGRSEPDLIPRTLGRMADDLEDLLTDVGDSQYVLIGHSLGGPIVRLLAYRRPDLIAGLVLIDPVAEDCGIYHHRLLNACVRAGYRLAAQLAASGVLQVLLGDRLHRQFPPKSAVEMTSEELSPTAFRTGAVEVAAMPSGLSDLLVIGRQGEQPNMPVTLISAGLCTPLDAKIRPSVVASHRRLAKSLARGRHVMAHNSDHLVPLHEPQLIIAETRRLIRQIREHHR